VEDLMTTTYLRDTAEQAGYRTVGLHVGDIGYHHIRGFTDLDEQPILNIFKLYPWEWMLREDFGKRLSPGLPYWIEPAWRMILSNKGVLPILWELFPEHPNILPAYTEPAHLREWVKKPRLGREGENVEVVTATAREAHDGGYGAEAFVYQQYFSLPLYDGQHPIVGSWVVDQEAAGVGIRESEGLITRNESPFVPHIIEDR
jgi:glutathionylspermidine synthase